MAGTLKYVLATVLAQNGVQFLAALGRTPLKREIDCESVVVRGVEYFIPVKDSGQVQEYTRRMDGPGFLTDSVGNPVINDSIKALHLWDAKANNNIWIALDSDQDATTFTNFCNQCCGQGNDFTTGQTAPATPILEDTVCPTPATGTATYNYLAASPANPYGSNIIPTSFTYNGGKPTPVAFTAGGYASVAALVTWANTNLGALGTWSSVNGQLALASTTVKNIHLELALVPKTYCLTLGALTATSLVVRNSDDTADVSIPITPISTDVSNSANVANLVRSLLAGTVTVVPVSSVDHVQYIGTQKPVRFTDGTTSVTFASGAC